MPNCVIKGCKNHTGKNKKEDGITYHMFPNKAIKEKWIEVIRLSRNEPSWNPTAHSVVCSQHFDDDDFYYTNKGLRRVVRNRYPKILSVILEQLHNTELSQTSNVYQSAAPNQSDDLSESQPSTTYNDQSALLDSACLNLIQPSSYYGYQLDVEDQSYDLKISQQPPAYYDPLTVVQVKLEQELKQESEPVPEQVLAQVLKQELDQESDQESEQESEQVLEQVSKQELDQESDQESQQMLEQVSKQELDQESDQESEQMLEQVSKQELDQESDQESERESEQESEQVSESASEQELEQDKSTLDSWETSKLQERVSILEKKLQLNKKKSRTLHQKMRRLQKRNKSLDKIILNLKNRKIRSNFE